MRVRSGRRALVLGLVLAGAFALARAATAGGPIDDRSLLAFVDSGDVQSLRTLGPPVVERLARAYPASDVGRRARIAQAFYALGWKSPEAKRVLMADAHTSDSSLRLQVQWALGRVSADPDVIDVLLDNMRHDPVPLFRDKAACALAYDQIHLAPAQKLRLFGGLIDALDDAEPQVRAIAALALQILTGQNKGYAALGRPEARRRAIAEWRLWLRDLEANL
jgi:HEAT repeat protein